MNQVSLREKCSRKRVSFKKLELVMLIILSENFRWNFITTGDLLRKEVQKKTQIGKRIQECFKEYHYGKLQN